METDSMKTKNIKDKKTPGRFVRLPNDLDEAIRNYAEKENNTFSNIIRRFCEQGICNLSNNK